MNFAELQEAIQQYCQNTEKSFVEKIPEFVRQCEQKIYRVANLPATWQRATVSTSASTATATLPSNCLKPMSLQIDGDYPLMNKDASFIQAAYPTLATVGQPKVYAILNDTALLLAPTPDATYSITMDYMGFPTSIVDAGESWLGENAEAALLAGSLVNAYTYLKGDPDMLQTYVQQFSEEVAALANEWQQQETDENE